MMKGRERETVRRTDSVQMRKTKNKCGKKINLTGRQIKEGERVVEEKKKSRDWSRVPFPLSPAHHHHSPIQLTRFASFITLSVPLSVSLQ